MSTITLDTYVAGDSFAQDFLVRDLDGVPVDLTGSLIKWAIANGKPDDVGDQILVLSTVTSGVTITHAVNGKVRVQLTRGQFTHVGSFVHELEVTLPDASSYTVASGVFKAAAAVLAE